MPLGGGLVTSYIGLQGVEVAFAQTQYRFILLG
jgi:hypothetical protein